MRMLRYDMFLKWTYRGRRAHERPTRVQSLPFAARRAAWKRRTGPYGPDITRAIQDEMSPKTE